MKIEDRNPPPVMTDVSSVPVSLPGPELMQRIPSPSWAHRSDVLAYLHRLVGDMKANPGTAPPLVKPGLGPGEIPESWTPSIQTLEEAIRVIKRYGAERYQVE